MKKNTIHLLVSTLICFIPTIIGFILYSKLDMSMPIGFDAKGNATLYASKLFIIIGIPLTLAIINLVIHYVLNSDAKRKNMNGRIKLLMKYLTPLFTNILMVVAYLSVLGFNIDSNNLIKVIGGTLIILAGIFLLDNKNNSIRVLLPWTINDDELWMESNLFMRITLICGGIALICATYFTSSITVIYIILGAIIILPIIYSYIISRKK